MTRRREFFQGGVAPPNIDTHFAITEWTGDATARDIVTEIDLTDGGFLLIGDTAGGSVRMWSPLFGVNNFFRPTSRDVLTFEAGTVTAFNSDGFSLGTDTKVNSNGVGFVGISFRKAPRFIDLVTWTGDGTSNRQIPHGLGIEPGMIWVKENRSILGKEWRWYHKVLFDEVNTQNVFFIGSGAMQTGMPYFGNDGTNRIIPPTDEYFTVSGDGNLSGQTYYAILFAHDTSVAGVCRTVSYTGTGNNTPYPVVSGLGFKPQFIVNRGESDEELIFADVWDAINTREGCGTLDKFETYFVGNSAGRGGIDFDASGFSIQTDENDVNDNNKVFANWVIRE